MIVTKEEHSIGNVVASTTPTKFGMRWTIFCCCGKLLWERKPGEGLPTDADLKAALDSHVLQVNVKRLLPRCVAAFHPDNGEFVRSFLRNTVG